jgi:hypothetical protein
MCRVLLGRSSGDCRISITDHLYSLARQLSFLPIAQNIDCPHIAPSFGLLKGPITSDSNEPHPCFHARVFWNFQSACASNKVEVIECLETCTQSKLEESTDAPAHQPSTQPLPAICQLPSVQPLSVQVTHQPPPVQPLPAIIHQPLPIQPLSATQLLPAIHQPPPIQPLPATIHQPPPIQLLPVVQQVEVPLFIPDSPSPPPASTAGNHLPYVSLTSWRLQVDAELSSSDEEHHFFLKAENVDSAAQALLEFLVSIHSGQDNISRARRTELKVKIQPGASISGLFFTQNLTIQA